MTQRANRLQRKFLRIGAFLLSTVIISATMAISIFAHTEQKSKYDFPAGSASVNITLDTRRVLEGEAAIINSVTYVPLRAFSELLYADSILWNEKTRTATVKKGNTQISVRDGAYYIEASGRYFYTPERVLNIGDRLFVPVRPFAAAFCLDLEWNGATRTVELESTGRTLERGATYYDQGDLYWLSRIISAEAKGESLYGQIAVGNVVLNRVASRSYPNTVYGVIFDRVGGTQFSPVAIGTIYNTPTESAQVAAKICLEGYSISDRILFFMNPRIATNSWISRNRPYAFTIGNHRFYY